LGLAEVVIKIGSKTFRRIIPKDWSEVSRKQFLKIAPLFFAEQESRTVTLSAFLYCILDLDRKIFLAIGPKKIAQLIGEIEWMINPPSFRDSFMGRVGVFTGPGTLLNGSTLDGVGFADNFMQAYLENKKGSDLNQLFACLYRPPFVSYSRGLVEIMAFVAKFIPLKTKQAVLLNFMGLRSGTSAEFESVFSGGGKRDPFWFDGLQKAIAGSKWGDVVKCRNHDFFEVIRWLHSENEKAEKKKTSN